MKTIKKFNNVGYVDSINELSKNTNEYDSNILRKYLIDMYGGVCCYCESYSNISSAFNIEHFYPQKFIASNWRKKYLIHSKEIKNLHYSCGKCNQMKSNISPDGEDCFKIEKIKEKHTKKHLYSNLTIKYNEGVKIYSPNYLLDNEGKFYLPNYELYNKFEYNSFRIIPKDDNELRGEGTIKVFDLNNKNKKRIGLFENRIKKFNKALEITKMLNKLLLKDDIKEDIYIIDYFFESLLEMMEYTSEYSTMIQKNYGEYYKKLYKKYKQKKELNS